MAVTVHFEKNTLLVRTDGDFDLVGAEEFRAEADRALDVFPARHMILDLTRLTFMDSSGLGVILGRLRKIQARRGTMALAGANPSVLRVLELSGIMPLIDICASVDQAWALLARKEKEV
ncbi:MAG: anti-sigma factor antagonist [Peptococcaceae bacterium]|jgi:stage II sporulation protein AA (anti-sigma F factor antagonist)|nr:anti-sigma factor antagonist [Peptococcaceae bacterium]